MLRPPEPGSFEKRITPVEVPVGEMWRLSRFPATEPYFARSGHYRFDDPQGLVTPGATAFGTLYVAGRPETAFCESVFHGDALFQNGAFEVARSSIAERHLVGFAHATKTTLSLADLTGEALKKLGLNNDISAGDDDAMPQAWAKAIHDARPDLDGIRYLSRQNNAGYCYAVFDRSGLFADTASPLPTAIADALCLRFDVVPV